MSVVSLDSFASPAASGAFQALGSVRHDWTREEIRALFALPFPELIFQAQTVHRINFDPTQVQISTLLSIKTGGCPEDCAYCPQSSAYETDLKASKLMDVETVLAEAAAAKQDAEAKQGEVAAAKREMAKLSEQSRAEADAGGQES